MWIFPIGLSYRRREWLLIVDIVCVSVDSLRCGRLLQFSCQPYCSLYLAIWSSHRLLFLLVCIVIVFCLGLVVVAVHLRAFFNLVFLLTATLLLVLLLLRFGGCP